MSYFRNDAINRINLQSGIQALAQGSGQLFLLVFLLRAGVSIPGALIAQAGICVVRFALRPVILPLAIRFGVKPLFVAGAIVIAIQYPILAEVHGVGPVLVAMCVASAVGEVLYFISYNTYFAAVGDEAFRGHQIALGQALAAAAGVVAPLVAAWALVTAGPRWMFGAVAVLQMLSAIPLLGLPNVAVARSAPGAWRAARPAALLMVMDGWFDTGFFYVWQIALFVSLGESYAAYGGVMALAGLVGAVFGLVIGRHVDAGHGRRSVLIAYGAAAAVVGLRAVSLHTPWLAALANALGGVVLPLVVPPLATATHNMAKDSPCPLRTKMVSEGGWDVGCICASLAAAALATVDRSLHTAESC